MFSISGQVVKNWNKGQSMRRKLTLHFLCQEITEMFSEICLGFFGEALNDQTIT